MNDNGPYATMKKKQQQPSFLVLRALCHPKKPCPVRLCQQPPAPRHRFKITPPEGSAAENIEKAVKDRS